jgi:hypothetical protein
MDTITIFFIGFVMGGFAGILGGVFIALREFEWEYKEKMRKVRDRPAIDLSLLASIPGLKIQGSGIDIDTSKMVDKKSEVKE